MRPLMKVILLSLIVVYSVIPVLASEPLQRWESPAGAESLAADLRVYNNHLYMTWIEREDKKRGKLMLAIHDGDSWQKPEVVHASDKMFINWADIPAFAITDELMVITWLEMLGEGIYDYGIRYKTAPTKNGDGWAGREERWLHDDRSSAEHGFVSMAPLDHERIMAVWLDGRMMKGGHGSHGGSMQLRSRLISLGDLSPEELIDDNTCECCPTSIIKTHQGLATVFRNKSDDHIRDIYLARRQVDGWSVGAIHPDHWEIQGCPVNGPAIVDESGVSVVAWFTGADQRPRIKAKVIGSEKASPVTLAESGALLGRISMTTLSPGRVAISWVSVEEEQTHVKVAILGREGQKLSIVSSAKTVAQLPEDRAGGVPRLAAFRNQLVVAHLSNQKKGIQISVLPAQ